MVRKVTPKGTHMMRQKNDGVMVLIFCQGWQLKHTHSTRTNAESPQAIVIQRLGDFMRFLYRVDLSSPSFSNFRTKLRIVA